MKGTPLIEALGGSDVSMASTGASFTKDVLGHCGFNVSEQSASPAPSAPEADFSNLVSAKPSTPSMG